MARRSLLVTLFAGSIALVAQDAVASAAPRVRVSAELSCLVAGGVGIDLTVENTGSRVARIDPDLHVLIETVRRGGRQPGVVSFVFPAPGFDRIPPGESRTFLLTAGEPFEGEPAIDFSGRRIIVEVEVWLRRREHPVSATLTFPACGPPVAAPSIVSKAIARQP